MIALASDDEALDTVALVLAVPAVIAFASDDEADVTSDCTASDPDESPAPVRVREPNDQMAVGVAPVLVES